MTLPITFQIRLVQIQMYGSLDSFSVPTFVIKRMFLSNSVVNPILILLFYISLLIKRPQRTNTNDSTNTGTTSGV